MTKLWLRQHRSFIGEDRETELAMNMPTHLPSEHSDKAVLLVHGLGDSPYSFSDLATSLHKRGFTVQTLLLPGHGSDPKDLMLPSYSDWQYMVDHYANMLKATHEQVWLGGFSTGGNLVTIHALEQGGVDGLLLFSPGFQSRTPLLEKFAPLALWFTDGYTATEQNKARYTSAPLNGAIAYSHSAGRLRELLAQQKVTMPTLIAMSEKDSVVDPDAVRELYTQRFSNPKNQLIWYGESEFNDANIRSLTMKLDTQHISTGSHMSPLYSPNNPYYGVEGERRMCMNSFDQQANQSCEAGAEVWFSAWGYEEQGKIHARLTWNPYYVELESALETITLQ